MGDFGGEEIAALGVTRSNPDRKAKLEHFDNRKSDALRL
jgi:hypothetical protein